jgi:hypothetical protein
VENYQITVTQTPFNEHFDFIELWKVSGGRLRVGQEYLVFSDAAGG